MNPRPMPAPFSEQVTEAHEERLQRLETSMQDVATATALNAQKLDYVTEKIEDGFQSIQTRLDKGAAQFEQHEAALAEHRIDIGKLQDAEEARTRRRVNLERSIMAILGAAGTVAAKSAWAWVLSFFHH